MKRVTAFSGRRGSIVRSGTAALVTAGLVATGLVATASPSSAWGDDDPGVTMKLTSRTTDELTDGRNHIRALGEAEKDVWDGHVVLSFDVRWGDRLSHDDNPVIRLAGGIGYTGAGPDVTWTRLRVNFDTHRVTARINGGDRRPVLRVGDGDWGRGAWGDGGGDELRLTRAGAASLNRAADGTPFRSGNVFAGGCTGCSSPS
jgi:hypothetical protein